MRAWSLLLVGCVACGGRLPAPGQIGIPVKLTTRIDAHIDLRVRSEAQVSVQGQGQAGQAEPPPPPPPPPPVQIVAVENAPVPEFFGISLEGAQDVVFVLDVSGSMDEKAFGRLAQIHVTAAAANTPPAEPPPPPPDPNAPPPPPPDPNAPPPDPNAPAAAAPPAPEPPAPRKIDVAQSELIAALRQLPAGTRMNVLFFNDALDAYAPSFVVLDEATRTTLITFVDDSEPMGSTALAPAMRTAFLMNAHRIVLLSDGLGNVGGNADAVMRDAREAMRGGVRIDTIGLGAGQDARLLGALAKESGGLYQPM
ncbi:MAG TPA: hypothetical protein VFV99_30255 [Kofleriaceae bacterium]|nr:hypothetical protein [Kofleriaceae bacterium]